jgi:ribosomal protein S18 acetylase RimI-like enzyme
VPIRTSRPADLDAVVLIHRGELAQDVSPAFGDAFLLRFYGLVLASSEHRLLVATDGAEVLGFCHVAMQAAPLRAALRVRDLFTFAGRVVRSPRLLTSAVTQARRPTVGDWAVAAEIAFIAVDQRHAGRGLGTSLVHAANTAAVDAGKTVVVTKTSNRRLAAFYQREFGAVVTARFSVSDSTYEVLEWPAAQPG